MAYVTEFKCERCGKNKREIYSHKRGNVCIDCSISIEAHEKKMHLSMLSELPVERRLEILEEQMYELSKLENRLKAVELHFVTY